MKVFVKSITYIIESIKVFVKSSTDTVESIKGNA
jgi:hypothetical protein